MLQLLFGASRVKYAYDYEATFTVGRFACPNTGYFRLCGQRERTVPSLKKTEDSIQASMTFSSYDKKYLYI